MIHLKSMVFSPIQENTYILHNDEKECMIIDPGCYFDEEKEALALYINRTGLTPKLLLNTHCHLDHIFGNKFIHETFGIEPHIHPLEEQVLAYAPTSGLMYNLPVDMYEGKLHFVQPGETISLGDEQFSILFTPGHSPGSLSFYHEGQGILISGDALFRSSIGRTDLPLGDHATLINSIKTQLLVLPEETQVFSGHGAPTTIGDEKRNNPFLKD